MESIAVDSEPASHRRASRNWPKPNQHMTMMTPSSEMFGHIGQSEVSVRAESRWTGHNCVMMTTVFSPKISVRNESRMTGSGRERREMGESGAVFIDAAVAK